MTDRVDALGAPIDVGDFVAYVRASRSSCSIRKFMIDSFTPHMVRIRDVQIEGAYRVVGQNRLIKLEGAHHV